MDDIKVSRNAPVSHYAPASPTCAFGSDSHKEITPKWDATCLSKSISSTLIFTNSRTSWELCLFTMQVLSGWRCSRLVTVTAIRLRCPGFKPRPGQKFENENVCFRHTPAVVKACHRAG